MPIPKPKKNETKDKFIQRCMSNEVMKREYKDTKQRYAVCIKSYDKTKKASNNSTDLIFEQAFGDISIITLSQFPNIEYGKIYKNCDSCPWEYCVVVATMETKNEDYGYLIEFGPKTFNWREIFSKAAQNDDIDFGKMSPEFWCVEFIKRYMNDQQTKEKQQQ